MIENVRAQFKALRPPVRSLLLVFWVYRLVAGLVGVFSQVFLYQKFTSIELNVYSSLYFYFGIFLGFCLAGYLAGRYRINIKYGFLAGFVVMGASIFGFLFITNTWQAMFAMFAWGIGQGLFWLTMNTLELCETRDHERDFYSSLQAAGNQLLSMVGPAIATFLIWLSGHYWHFGPYVLLFPVAALFYLCGLLFLKNLRDYHPSPIRWSDAHHYLADRQNQAAQIYTFGNGFRSVISGTVPPLVILYVLGTTINVGFYSTVLGVLSVACIMFVASYRRQDNRLLIYGITTFIVVFATVFIGYKLTFAALVVYALVDGLINPLMGVSSHVVDLASMEIGRSDTDFYATMVLRDVFLWLWRTLGGFALLAAVSYAHGEAAMLSYGMYLLAPIYLVAFAGAILFLRKGRIGKPIA